MISLKRFISVITSLLIMAALAVIFFPRITGSNQVDPNLLNNKVSYIVYPVNGQAKSGQGAHIPMPSSKGDAYVITVPISEEYYSLNADLCFMFYHCTVEVFYEDQLLYQYGLDMAEKNQFIGSVYVIAPIPDEAWGHELQIRLTATEPGSEIGLDDITICPSETSYLYYLADNEVLFGCFFTVIMMSLVLAVTLICSRRLNNSQIRAGIYSCTFAFLLASWVFGYYGMNRLVFQNQRVCADLEYILLYLAPMPVAMYMHELERTKREKTIYAIIAGFFAVFTAVVMVLNYLTPIHFSKTLTIFHVLMAISCLYIIVSLYRDRRGNNIGKVITKYGLSFLVLFAVIDLIRFSLIHYTPAAKLDWLYVSIVPFGIIIFLATMVYGFIQNLLVGAVNRQERERLTTMAYTDSMTGLSNRAEYNRVVDEIRDKKQTDYAIIFFDLNYLKRTNDLYGHNMGDAYIKEVAIILRKTFGNDAFCGRLGGDEFITVLRGTRSKMVAAYLREFDEAIEELDQSKTYPFHISVPYGTAVSTKKRELVIDDAVKLADERMYEAKQKSKAKLHETEDSDSQESQYHDDRE